MVFTTMYTLGLQISNLIIKIITKVFCEIVQLVFESQLEKSKLHHKAMSPIPGNVLNGLDVALLSHVQDDAYFTEDFKG